MQFFLAIALVFCFIFNPSLAQFQQDRAVASQATGCCDHAEIPEAADADHCLQCYSLPTTLTEPFVFYPPVYKSDLYINYRAIVSQFKTTPLKRPPIFGVS